MQENFGQIDPNSFESPEQMWKAMMDGFGNVLGQMQQQQQPQQQNVITPQEMDRQIKVVNEMNTIEGKVPRLKTDKGFRDLFASHVATMRAENRLPEKSPGVADLTKVMQDFLGGFTASVEEAQKAINAQNQAKNLSTATASDNSTQNPAMQPTKSVEDSLADELIEYTKSFQEKYR